MSIDLKLDLTTNDLIYQDGKFIPLKDTLEEARQRIQIRLRAWEGEWFLDNTFGLPYRQQIIKKNVNKADIDALVIEAINEVDIVNTISNFNSIILARTYIVRFTANVTFEQINNIRGSEFREWTYPDGETENPILPCIDPPETDPSTFNIDYVFDLGM